MSRAFICHADRDHSMAERLHSDLVRSGHRPWLAIYDLQPGEDWQARIRHEIGRCNYFLALLSAHALSKRGFVQAELRIALEILQLYPTSKRFLIPIRLEECNPRDTRLAALQWVDLFPSYEEGFAKLVHFLGRRRRPRPSYRSLADHGIEIPDGINRWPDQRVRIWVERELWPMLIDRARRAYDRIDDENYTSDVLDHARQLLTATARDHDFLAAYERAIKNRPRRTPKQPAAQAPRQHKRA